MYGKNNHRNQSKNKLGKRSLKKKIVLGSSAPIIPSSWWALPSTQPPRLHSHAPDAFGLNPL